MKGWPFRRLGVSYHDHRGRVSSLQYQYHFRRFNLTDGTAVQGKAIMIFDVVPAKILGHDLATMGLGVGSVRESTCAEIVGLLLCTMTALRSCRLFLDLFSNYLSHSH